MTHDLLLKNVRPWGAAATDILIRDGRIEVIAQNQSAEAVPCEDCANDILLPGLVEAHTHLDKTLWGMGWRPHQAGHRLIDKIETDRRLKTEWNIDPARQSKRQTLLSISHGSTAIRSHVDIDTEIGLEGVEGVLATKQDLDDVIDIEIVAFPQSGLMTHQWKRFPMGFQMRHHKRRFPRHRRLWLRLVRRHCVRAHPISAPTSGRSTTFTMLDPRSICLVSSSIRLFRSLVIV